MMEPKDRKLENDTLAGSPAALAAAPKGSLAKALLQKPEMGTILPLAILMIAVAIVNANFFNITNLLDICLLYTSRCV